MTRKTSRCHPDRLPVPHTRCTRARLRVRVASGARSVPRNMRVAQIAVLVRRSPFAREAPPVTLVVAKPHSMRRLKARLAFCTRPSRADPPKLSSQTPGRGRRVRIREPRRVTPPHHRAVRPARVLRRVLLHGPRRVRAWQALGFVRAMARFTLFDRRARNQLLAQGTDTLRR